MELREYNGLVKAIYLLKTLPLILIHHTITIGGNFIKQTNHQATKVLKSHYQHVKKCLILQFVLKNLLLLCT